MAVGGSTRRGRNGGRKEGAHETPRVLFVCHNHPSVYPGGAEGYALQVYGAMRDSGMVEPYFLARYGATANHKPRPHPGTPFSVVGGDDHQYFMYTEAGDFDSFYLTLRNKEIYTTHYRDFLLAIQPEIVHFQHTHYMGHDLLRQTRNTLPDVPILYSLHEYHSICHRDGVMVRTVDEEPCLQASPRRCHECFPGVAPQEFFMRQRFLQSHFREVDRFLAPSRFLLDRYAEWGIPRDKLHYHEHGLIQDQLVADGDRPARNRLGFFGQFSRYKGVDVLLRAIEILAKGQASTDSDALRDTHLWLHGANLEWQAPEFQEEVRDLVAEMADRVTWVGKYEERDIPRLMSEIDWVIVPSRWWENSPRVIQEAFQYGRPVICAGIGALAEKVEDGVSGLHFRAGDPASLAATLRRAVTTPGLWDQLRHGIPRMRSIEQDVAALIDLYRQLMAGRRNNGRAH